MNLKKQKKIFLLIFSPIIPFNYSSEKGIIFFRDKKNNNSSNPEFNFSYNRKVEKKIAIFLQNENFSSLVFVNHPKNLEQVEIFIDEIRRKNLNLSKIIILNITNQELFLKLRESLFVCSNCGGLHEKDKMELINKKIKCTECSMEIEDLSSLENKNNYFFSNDYLASIQKIIKKINDDLNTEISLIKVNDEKEMENIKNKIIEEIEEEFS